MTKYSSDTTTHNFLADGVQSWLYLTDSSDSMTQWLSDYMTKYSSDTTTQNFLADGVQLFLHLSDSHSGDSITQ